jgi:hypothetical protein
MDRRALPLATVAQHYFTACRTEGKTTKTLRGYNEKPGPFLRWFDGPLGDLSLATAREFVAELQDTDKWQERQDSGR